MTAESNDLPVIPDERIDDLHGLDIADQADLVIFMAGNQFMVMPRLMAAFGRRHPEIRRIFYETLPPKIELRQILAGGARFRGRVIATPPDVYTAVSSDAVAELAAAGRVDPKRCFVYLHNRLALMVAAGNPQGISSVQDLARSGIRISQPNPRHEDIAAYTLQMYRQAGGQTLVDRIMKDKQEAGETLLTTVHHRETPRRIMDGAVDAGPVWATEVAHAEREGWPLAGIAPGAALDQREAVRYVACPLGGGRNPANAAAFLAFLASDTARGIYADFGFTPSST
jgi:ABC-type molybdate transport system substrate-binding protein